MYAYRTAANPGEANRRPFPGTPDCQVPYHEDSFKSPISIDGRQYHVSAPVYANVLDLNKREWHWSHEVNGRIFEVTELQRPDPTTSLREKAKTIGYGTTISIDGIEWTLPRLTAPTGHHGPDVPTYFCWTSQGIAAAIRPEHMALCQRAHRIWRTLAALHGVPSAVMPDNPPTDQELIEFAADCIVLCHDVNRGELSASKVIDQASSLAICYEACGVGLAIDELKKKELTLANDSGSEES